MRATLTCISSKFKEFNETIFGGALPSVTIRISGSLGKLGSFEYPVRRTRGVCRPAPERDLAGCCIRISSRLDMPEDQIEDVLIHEMIHYKIWYDRLEDVSAHGPVFRKMMNDINRRFNRNISVRGNVTGELSDSDTRVKNHYIAVTEWKDGTVGMSPVCRTWIFDIHSRFAGSPDLVALRWYWSQDSYFNRFKTFRSARYYKMTAEMLSHIGSATPCACEGNRFHPE